MPMNKGCSVNAFQANISTSVKEGKPQKQALAIAFNVLRGACGVKDSKLTTAEQIVKAGKGKTESTNPSTMFPAFSGDVDAGSIDEAYGGMSMSEYVCRVEQIIEGGHSGEPSVANEERNKPTYAREQEETDMPRERLSEAKKPKIKGKNNKDTESGRIWIGNLGAYNRGKLIGQWLELPTSDSDIDDMIEEILDAGGDENDEEIFIADYELPFSIGEYEDPHEVNAVMDMLEERNIPYEVFKVIVDNIGGIKYLLDDPGMLEDIDYIEDVNDDQDLGYALADMVGGVDELDPKTLAMYFNYDSYGRDARLSGDYVVEKGFAIRNV